MVHQENKSDIAKMENDLRGEFNQHVRVIIWVVCSQETLFSSVPVVVLYPLVDICSEILGHRTELSSSSFIRYNVTAFINKNIVLLINCL